MGVGPAPASVKLNATYKNQDSIAFLDSLGETVRVFCLNPKSETLNQDSIAFLDSLGETVPVPKPYTQKPKPALCSTLSQCALN